MHRQSATVGLFAGAGGGGQWCQQRILLLLGWHYFSLSFAASLSFFPFNCLSGRPLFGNWQVLLLLLLTETLRH